jgi:uncharacterized protein (TIGR02145 family)
MKKRTHWLFGLDVAGNGAWRRTQLTAMSFKTVASGLAALLLAVAPCLSQQPVPSSGPTGNVTAQTKGTYTDSRDHKTYRTVRIGRQIWFAENFAYLPEVDTPEISVYGYTGNSVSEAKATDSYRKYGALYTWEEAKKLAPEEWRLPTDADWQLLEEQIGLDPQAANTMGWRGKNREADLLKAAGSSGFDVLFGGWRSSQGTFNFQGEHANFWVADGYDAARAYERLINYKNGSIGRDVGQKGCGFSVRYVQDLPNNANSF